MTGLLLSTTEAAPALRREHARCPSPARRSPATCGGGYRSSTAVLSTGSWLLCVPAENQVRGSPRNHVGRRVCPRPRNDLWHHGGVRHAQTQNAVHAELWVDNSELVHAHFARTNCLPKTRPGQSGKFLDLLGARLGPWNELALAQIVNG